MTSDPQCFLTPGKIQAEEPVSLRLTYKHLERHLFIAGGTGNGKSKLIELLARQLISLGWGFTYIDPHGDGVESLLPYLNLANVDPQRVHYLKPGPEHCFSFDPYADAPDGNSIVYDSWLISTADRVARAFLRNVSAADQEMMRRLKRWLKNMLYVCGVNVNGRHLGLSKALLLTDPKRPEFDVLLETVAPHLQSDMGRDVLADFRKLQATPQGRQQELWVESTINLLRDTLSPVVRLIFDQRAPSLRQKDIIQERGIQLVNLRKSDYVSREQGNVIGGLLINFLLHAAENLADTLPPEKRIPHFVIIDEAENFIGEDLRMAFAELRKFGISICIAVQDLTCLRKGDLDLVNKVVSQCGLQMTFQQQSPEDIEFLGKAFGYGSLDLTPLLVDQVLPDGYDWVPTQSLNVSASASQSISTSATTGMIQSRRWQRTSARTIQEQVSLALSQSESHGTSLSTGESEATSESHQESRTEGATTGQHVSSSRTDGHVKHRSTSVGEVQSVSQGQSQRPDGKAVGRHVNSASSQSKQRTEGESVSASQSESQGSSQQQSQTESVTEGHSSQKGTSRTRGQNATRGRGTAVTTGESQSIADGISAGASESNSQTQGNSRGQESGNSVGYGVSETPLAKHKIEKVVSGKTVVSVQDQLYAIMNSMAALQERMVLVRCRGMASPFVMKVHDVRDAYAEYHLVRSPAWQAAETNDYLDSVLAAQEYFFVPSESNSPDVIRSMASRNGIQRKQKPDQLCEDANDEDTFA